MMRSTDFFIDKAKEYTSSIDEILPNLQQPYLQGSGPSPEDKERSEKISDIRLKTRQLFSEFDKGELFRKNIVSIDENKMIGTEDEEMLERYKHTLSLFINHVTELSK